MSDLRLIGYWRAHDDPYSSYPHPSDWIDLSWDQEERSIVGGYLASGTLLRAFMGCSPCRICGRDNGAAEYTDGVYAWPEGLAHYVDDHGVRLPAEVVAHAVARSEELESLEVSDAWWQAQPKQRRGVVTAVSSPDLLADGQGSTQASEVTHEVASDGDDPYLAPSSVWARMARILGESHGQRILRATARATLANGAAEVSWTEVHHLTGAAFEALVARARDEAG